MYLPNPSAQIECDTRSIFMQRLTDPPPPSECLGYNTKQSDGEATVMLEL